MDRERTASGTRVSPVFQHLIVLAVTLRFIMGAVDSSILPLGISSIVWDLGADYASFLFLAEGVIFVSTLIFAGRLGDVVGMKRIFLAGIGLFTLGSLLSAGAESLAWLLLSRSVSSIGLTLSLAVSLPLIMVTVDEQRRGRSIGYTVMGVGIGSVAGPVICGGILEQYGWNLTFLVLVPVGLLILLIGLVSIPGSPGNSRKGAGDYPGVFLIFLTLGVFSIGMNLGFLQQNLPLFLEALAISLLAGYLFLAWEKRAADPLIDLSFLTRRSTLEPLCIAFSLYCAYRMSLYFLPIYLSEILSVPPFMGGVIMSGGAVICVVCSPLSGIWMERKGMPGIRSLLILSGLFGLLSGGVMMAAPFLGNLPAIGISLLLLNLMFGLGSTGVYGFYYATVPRDQAGMAGGIMETVIEFACLMSISCVQVCFTSGIAVMGDGSISVSTILEGSTPGVQAIYLLSLLFGLSILLLSRRIRG